MSNNFINLAEKKIILINKKKSEVCKNLPKEDLLQRRTIEAIRSRLFDSYKEGFKKAKTIDRRLFYLGKVKEIVTEIKQDLREKLKKRREEKLNLLNKKKEEIQLKQKIDTNKPLISYNQSENISNKNCNKSVPIFSSLTKEFVERNWKYIRPCNPYGPLEKKPKKKNGYRYFIFNGY